MKKFGFLTSFASLTLVYGLANLILFLLIPEGRTELASFWIAWSFTFPFCFLTTLGVTLYCVSEKNLTIVKLPLLFPIQYTFCAIFLVAGLILMGIGVKSTSVVWIVEAIITTAFLISIIYAWSSSYFLSRDIKYTKAKIFYIRSLKVDVDDCINRVSDSEIAKQLTALSEKIRFSDPMSHESLRDSEVRLQALISQISEKIALEQLDDIPTLIKKAIIELESRNNRCKLLK